MSIQTTQRITREDAEKMFVENYVELNRERLTREAKLYSDGALEELIETTFDNFEIVKEDI